MSGGQTRALPSRQSFDVLVFGSQIAGAVAGALLARRGYRVLAIPHDAGPSTYRHGDWLLPCAPSLFPALRNLPHPLAILEELGLATEVARALVPQEPLQLITPTARVDLPREPAPRAVELSRAFGPEGSRLAGELSALLAAWEREAPFFRALPPIPAQGLLDRLRLRRALRTLPAEGPASLPAGDPGISLALRELWRLGSFLADDAPPSAAALRPLASLLRGAHRYPGGRTALAASLRARIPTSGGQLLETGPSGEPAELEGLRLERGKVVSAVVTGSPHDYRARAFIAALPSVDLRELLPPSTGGARLAAFLDGVRQRSCLLPLNLVVPLGALPPGLADSAICVSEGSAPRALLVQLSVATRADGSQDRDHRVIQLAGQVPIATFSQGDAELRAALRDLRAAADGLFPFLSEKLLLESSPHLAAEGRLSSSLRPHALVEVGLPRQLGVTGLPPISPCPNLLLANREVLPGLGLEGEFITGARVAKLVADRLPKGDPLSRR